MNPGQRIGPYLLEQVLGKGGMGAVYRARDPQGRAVALKVLHGLDQELIARFQREAEVLRHLDSPRIVRLLDFGVHRGRPYLVQELCEGGDLAGVLARRGALPPEEVRELGRELAAGLEVAHRAGVVHRDLKPANVLLHEGQPKLTDFGLARAKGIDRASLTETGVILGTPAYMAPEQLQDAREVDGRADVYALGAILYELLAGRQAFAGRGVLEVADKVLQGRWEPLADSIPEGLRRVIARAMALEVSERYVSAEALAEDLLESDPSEAPSSGGPSKGLLVASLSLVAVLAAVTLALFGGSGLDPAVSPQASIPSPALSPATTPARATPTQAAPRPADPAQERRAVHAALDLCADEDSERAAAGLARLRQLVEEGNRRADLALGRLYLTGAVLPRDLAEAREHLARAKAGGLVEAEVLLTYTRPVKTWRPQASAIEDILGSRAQQGNIDAAWLLHGRSCNVVGASGEVGRLAQLFDLTEDAQRLPIGTRGRVVALQRVHERTDPEARVQQVVLHLQLGLDGAPLPAGATSARQALLHAAGAGSARAEGILGHKILVGQIPGTPAEGELYLRRWALKGFANAALTLWREGQEAAERRFWLRYAARLGHPDACGALGIALHEEGRGDEARPWLEYSVELGDPNASGALADLLQQRALTSSEAQEVRVHALHGLMAGRGDYLRTVGLSLLDPRGGDVQTSLGLTILAGLALREGGGEAALAAAEAARRLPERRGLVRSLLRRALSQEATRTRAELLLAEETRGIASSAPPGSQSQLVLETWAKAQPGEDEASRGRRDAAWVELGRRARGELRGAKREEAMRRAAETGDPESALAYGQLLYLGSQPRTARRAEAIRYYLASGLPAGKFFARLESGSLAQAMRALRQEAEAEEPDRRAIRYLAMQLRRMNPKSAEAQALMEKAAALGDLSAQEDLRWESLKDPERRAETLAYYEEHTERYRLELGKIYLRGRHAPLDLGRALDNLLAAALGGESADAYSLFGEGLAKLGQPRVAILWLQAGAERGDPAAGLAAARLMLTKSNLELFEEGSKLLDELIARGEGHGEAKLLKALALVNAPGWGGFERAERLLREVIASPSSRSRFRKRAKLALASKLLRRGDREQGEPLLEELAATGDFEARLLLARCFLHGVLLSQDVERGRKILEEDARRGSGEAAVVLAGELLERDGPLERDPARARAILDAIEIGPGMNKALRPQVAALRARLEGR